MVKVDRGVGVDSDIAGNNETLEREEKFCYLGCEVEGEGGRGERFGGRGKDRFRGFSRFGESEDFVCVDRSKCECLSCCSSRLVRLIEAWVYVCVCVCVCVIKCAVEKKCLFWK